WRPLSQSSDRLLSAARRFQGGMGQYRYLRMARLSDADQNKLPLPRFDPRRTASPRPRAVSRLGASRGNARNPGMAVVLLQGADARGQGLSRARHLHPAHEAQEHAALDARRRSDHASRPRVLRLVSSRVPALPFANSAVSM